MVDGVLLEWTHHRIVGAEWNETLSNSQRQSRCGERPCGAGDQLVEICVRMAPVNVSLTPDSRSELSSLEGQPLEVEHSIESDAIVERRQRRHQHRLRDITFGNTTPRVSGRSPGSTCDGLRAHTPLD